MIFEPKQLEYLFVAVFDDGFTYEQNKYDKATIVEKGSCFSDLLELQKDKSLHLFSLLSEDKNIHLNLKTGEFNINGVDTFVNPSFEGKFVKPLKLIYFRRNTIEMSVNVKGGDPKFKKATTTFCIGYETTINNNGKSEKFKQIISVT